MFRRSANTKVIVEYEKLLENASSEVLRNRHSQAATLYGQAIRLIDRNFGPTDKPGCLRLLAECYKRMGNFAKATRCLQEAIQTMKHLLGESNSEVMEAIKLEMHDAWNNLGLLQLDEVEALAEDDDNEMPYRVFELLASSKKSLLQAHRLTKQQLRSGKRLQNNEWYEYYCSDLLNIVNVNIVEAEMFQERSGLEQILRLVQQAQRFYSIHSAQFKLKSVLSKCYYSKGIAYRFLKNYPQAEAYLKKDNAYCKKYHLTDQLSKNKLQLIKLYLILNQYDKAFHCVEDSNYQKKKQLQSLNHNYRKFKEQMSAFNPSVFTLEEYIELADKMLEYDYIDQLITTTKTIIRLNSQRTNVSQQFQFNYYLAECYYKQKKYDISLSCLRDCEAYITKNTKQWFEFLFLKANIVSEVDATNRLKVQQAYNQCLELARRLEISEFQNRCQSNLRIYRNELHFKNMEQPQISDDQEIFQTQFNSFKKSYVREEVAIIDEPPARRQPQKKQRTQGVEYYKQRCAKYKMPVNQYIIGTILSKKPLAIKNIASFSERSLLILIKAVFRPIILDLSNNTVTDEFIEKLIGYIEKKKIDLSELESFIIGSRLTKSRNLQKLLLRSQKLQTFKFCRSIISQAFAINYSDLRVLKLKQCRITDSILNSIPFSNMNLLNTLNLSGNHLTSYCFPTLNFLNQIGILNLSDNRLGDSQGSNLFLSVRDFRLKSTIFADDSVDRVFQVIKFVQALDVSRSINPRLLFEKMYQKYVHEHYIMKIKSLKINEITLTPQCVAYIKSFILSAPALQQLELVGIHDASQMISEIVDCTLMNCRNIQRIDIRRSNVSEEYRHQLQVLM